MAKVILKAIRRSIQGLRHSVQAVQKDGAGDPEAIHNLRVACRRVEACLTLFRPQLGSCGWWKTMLAKVRRHAGQVRDCDILAEELAEQLSADPALADKLVRRRKKQSQRLLKRLQTLTRKSYLKERGKRLANRIQQTGKKRQPSQALGGDWFAQRIRPFARTVKKQLRRLPADFRKAHALRLAVKRLRYGLEITLAAQGGLPLAQLIDRLREWQDQLGSVCDAEGARRLVDRCLKQRQPADELHAAQKKLGLRGAAAWRSLHRWATRPRIRSLNSALELVIAAAGA